MLVSSSIGREQPPSLHIFSYPDFDHQRTIPLDIPFGIADLCFDKENVLTVLFHCGHGIVGSRYRTIYKDAP